MSSEESDLEENLRNLKLEDKDINILLLGETGVGKSTFINAVANYLSLKYFDNAEKEGLVVLIPTVFKIANKNGKIQEIKVGPENDKNELLESGESATQDVRTYVFPVWRGRVNVRLIDTPGMGDTRGIEQDEKNCDYIVRYLKTLNKVHAICFLFKPTEARKTVYFEYCMFQMLSRLDKTACKNIFFLFTNTRGSDYGPGDTFSNLKSFMKHLQAKTTGVEIAVDKNKFCFDNEAFKFLAGLKKKVKFDDSIKEINLKSWQESAKQCWWFIRRLQKETTPYSTDNLLQVNYVRRLMLQLSKVLSDIKQLVDANQVVIERLKMNRNFEIEDIRKLKDEQKCEVSNVKTMTLNQTLLVCTSRTCADVYRVNGISKWHYKTVCHSPCNETYNEVKDVRGCPNLVTCNVIDQTTRCCRKCGCDFSVHMHVDYITKLEKNVMLDEEVSQRIAIRESLLDSSMEIINDITSNNKELLIEHETIQDLQYNIAIFLQKNAIIASSNSYKEYIEYLMNQKKIEGASDSKKMEDLKSLLREHEENEKVFHRALQKNASSDLSFDSRQLTEIHLKKLFNLTHNGSRIKQIYDELKKLEKEAPPKVKEYVHNKCYEKEDDQNNKSRRGGNQNQRRDGKPHENFSQKQRDRKGSEKQREFVSRNKGRDFSRDRLDHREGGRQNRESDQRYRQDSRATPPVYPQEAHGGYPEPQHNSMNYDRDRANTERNQHDPRYYQDPRMAPPPHPFGAHGGYSEHPQYASNYDRGRPHGPYPPPPGQYPPPPGPHPPTPGPYPPHYGHYPPQYGAYPAQYPYSSEPQAPHSREQQGARRSDVSPTRRPHNPSRPARNRRNNRDGKRNDDRRGRGGQTGGRGRDGQSFKPRNRKPQNKSRQDKTDDDSDGSDSSSD
ncbi:uncharacterized protein isoform X2 [Leptinotarsa decemlineata]|uniref:uncharacterized protein isoform X2 n=1 Tax=Leptinotarsa decemlineata TaxID=7539 RepID=UPI003D303F0A